MLPLVFAIRLRLLAFLFCVWFNVRVSSVLDMHVNKGMHYFGKVNHLKLAIHTPKHNAVQSLISLKNVDLGNF